ncbi:MAG TPA: T9SS type A sorting domain-containing protein [Flavobacteriales bacterium]|nr:T9SS type A sorting domain-containing protein [Flavobacteriales bacterium]
MRHFFTLILTCTAGLLSAQNLQITDGSGNVLNGTTQTHTGLSTDSEVIADGYYVHNTSGAAMGVRCKREEISVVANTENNVCWALCSSDYTAGAMPVLIAPGGSININSGDSINAFYLHYKPDGFAGVSLFKVTFYNPSVASDTAVVYVQFDVALSVTDVASKALTVNAYPNPANNFINIDIENLGSKSTLRIVDALGITVKTATLNGDANVKFNTSDLRAGVYFYSLMTNDKVILTRRMVITR